MRATLLMSLCVAALAYAAEEITEDEGVLVLTEKNFAEAIAAHKHILVEFYAPWCGHCKALAPEYAAAAKKLKEENSELRLAKVDATAETHLAETYEVRGYPTLKFFANGSPSEYRGGRKADEIIAWLKKKTGPAAKHIENADDLKAFRAEHDVAVIGAFEKTAADYEKLRAFEAAAGDSELPFAYGLNDLIIGAISSDVSGLDASADSIVLFKKGESAAVYGRTDEGEKDASVTWEAEDITKWTALNQLPLVVEFSPETAPKIFGGDIKRHALLFASRKQVDFDELLSEFRGAAQKLRSRMLFILLDADIDENSRVMDFFSVKKTDLPDIRAIQLGDEMTKYRMPSGDRKTDSIVKFAEDVLEKRIKPHMLSQDLPADWDATPVKVLVSSNFDAIARDKKKHVFVEFYAPWCGHCKALAPIWEQLGELYKDREDFVIAKMDSTQNEVEGVRVSGFPTLKWFGKDTDEVVDYSGDRSLEALKKFIDSDGKQQPAEQPEEEEEEEEEEDEHAGHDHKKEEL